GRRDPLRTKWKHVLARLDELTADADRAADGRKGDLRAVLVPGGGRRNALLARVDQQSLASIEAGRPQPAMTRAVGDRIAGRGEPIAGAREDFLIIRRPRRHRGVALGDLSHLTVRGVDLPQRDDAAVAIRRERDAVAAMRPRRLAIVELAAGQRVRLATLA